MEGAMTAAPDPEHDDLMFAGPDEFPAGDPERDEDA